MFSGISNWFNRQIATIETAHAEISWEESLDNAILQINAIKDVETDEGQERLSKIIKELKRAEKYNTYTHQDIQENTLG